jgi:superfamily II DNA or RNA helicase
MSIDLSLFGVLKRPTFENNTAGYAGAFFFMLSEEGEDWWLQAVDKKGNPVDPNYRAYSGRERDRIKAYQQACTEETIGFHWDTKANLANDGIVIGRHANLLTTLLDSGQLVDKSLQPLSANSENQSLMLFLQPVESKTKDSQTMFQARYAIQNREGDQHFFKKPRFVTDSCIKDGNALYRIEPIGSTYRAAPLFQETVPAAQIDTFLSLFTSSFPEVAIDYSDFSIENGSPIPAQPAVLFSEVDENSALYLQLADVLPNLSIEFVRDYDLSRIAHVDPTNRIVRLSDVNYEASHAARAELIKKMQKLDRCHKSSEAYFTECDNGGFVLGPDLAKSFLTEHLAEFAGQFALFGAEKLKKYKITHSKPKLHLKLGSGIDFFEGEGTIEIDQEHISLLDALKQYQKNRYITLSDGTQAVLDDAYMSRLNRLFKKRKNGLKVSFFDLPLIDELIDARDENADFVKSREVFAGFNTLSERRVSLSRFSGKLRPYQKAGVQWMDYLYENKLGGCLADDMGLGKTVQTIALLSRIYPKAKKPTLIVMPRSLLFNWARELETFAPELKFCIYHSTGRDWAAVSDNQIILTTYGTLRSDIESIVETAFHVVILDESQAIKNLNTKTAQAALTLKANFRLALSGTPVENNLGELYTLFRFLNPSMFSSAADFDRDYAQPIQKGNDDAAASELRKKIYPFILRRLKNDVVKDLPPKLEQVLYVEMGEDQKKHYEERRLFYKSIIDGEIQKNGIAKSQFVILEAMLELRQIATVPESKTEGLIKSAKSERLLEALEEAVGNGHKCLVFSNFLAGVEQVCTALNTREIKHLRMTGATTDRETLVHRFQNDPRTKVFVMSLKTGGVGLNLTAADTVFILDPWWNTSAEAQAVDRAHRIGQQNTVFTYRLIAKDSIEEKIRQLQQQKKNLVDQVVSSDGVALKSLSEQDIENLFSA